MKALNMKMYYLFKEENLISSKKIMVNGIHLDKVKKKNNYLHNIGKENS